MFLPALILAALFLGSLSFVSGPPFQTACKADGVSLSYMWVVVMAIWYVALPMVLLVCAWLFYKSSRKTECKRTLWLIFLIPIGPIAVFFFRSLYCDGISGAIEFTAGFFENGFLYIALSLFAAILPLASYLRRFFIYQASKI